MKNAEYVYMPDQKYVALDCDQCGKENILSNDATDIQSAMFNADYALHSYTCAYCLHDNFMISYKR